MGKCRIFKRSDIMAFQNYTKNKTGEYDAPTLIFRHLDRMSATVCQDCMFGLPSYQKAIKMYSETLELENYISYTVSDPDVVVAIKNAKKKISFDEATDPQGFLIFFEALSLWRKILLQAASSNGLLKRDIVDNSPLEELEKDQQDDIVDLDG